MGPQFDDELCQDFLVEAGETLEQLSQSLVTLEQTPDDLDLLNHVFRGFHNVKGGAGFLGLDALVEVCHGAEDIFNVLRQGERRVDPELMDVILRALDVINDMVDQIREGEAPSPAESSLLEQLRVLAQPGDAGVATDGGAAAVPEATTEAAETAQPEDLTDQEFEALLDTLPQGESSPPAAVDPAADEITDDEFEVLLDELHGPGRHGGMTAKTAAATAAPSLEKVASVDAPSPGGGDEEITDKEFEALLDELHGPGSHDGVPRNRPSSPQPPPREAAKAGSDDITDEEFEALLDELHGTGSHGGAPAKAVGAAPAPQAPKAAKKAAGEAALPAAAPGAASKSVAVPGTVAVTGRKSGPKAAAVKVEKTIRVDTKRLDDIMNMVGELVLVRNRLTTIGGARGDEDLVTAVGNLDVVTADLQLAVMKTRMQPIKKVFGRFPRVVRDLARSLNKEVNLEMQGEETDLDKNLVEALADPLVHLVRNAVDHGLEMPDEREAAGKPRTGTVVLTAEQEGDHILLTVEDDGSGMDAEKFRRKAVEKGMMDADVAARLDDEGCYNLIFLPAFSTKTDISDVSGRGVGMDVVKTRITQLNGSIEIKTEPGKGTHFLIKVPLTLAIMPTLMFMLGSQIYALPLLSVVEIVERKSVQTKTIDGRLVMLLRDKALPLWDLGDWLLNGATRPVNSEESHILVTSVGSQRVGFVVDQLLGQEEVVIKPLGTALQGTLGLAGATITGNGRIALILDVPGLIQSYVGQMWEISR